MSLERSSVRSQHDRCHQTEQPKKADEPILSTGPPCHGHHDDRDGNRKLDPQAILGESLFGVLDEDALVWRRER